MVRVSLIMFTDTGPDPKTNPKHLGWYGQLIRDLRRQTFILQQPALDRVATAAKPVAAKPYVHGFYGTNYVCIIMFSCCCKINITITRYH